MCCPYVRLVTDLTKKSKNQFKLQKRLAFPCVYQSSTATILGIDIYLRRDKTCVIFLTLYFIMLKNDQTYFKNLAVWTPQDC